MLRIALLLALALQGNLANKGGLREQEPEKELPAFSSAGSEHCNSGACTEMPDESGSLDHPGPYAEEPSETEATKPKPAAVQNSEDFCNVHETGFWCNGSTRLRCCKLQEGNYAKCGSAVNSSFCGWQSPAITVSENTTIPVVSSAFSRWWSPPWDSRRRSWGGGGGGGGWHIHPGWHVSSYCESHHVGQFCSNHQIIHCCSDYGHWVECNTQYHHSSWYC